MICSFKYIEQRSEIFGMHKLIWTMQATAPHCFKSLVSVLWLSSQVTLTQKNIKKFFTVVFSLRKHYFEATRCMEGFRVISGPESLRGREGNGGIFVKTLVLLCDEFIQLRFVSTDFY